ncbi:MAG: phage terminase large subunit family protein, partial [Sphingomonas sp.]|uniref:phage terminase large subunit family protein n=1 Tax=Sphingomonas sp. TaxID=28214 RepID=UPI003F7E27C4
QAFSTPTFVGYGIDKKHKMGDQREYMCRCPACNHWQIPRFSHEFVHIDNFHFDVETFMELTPDQISLLDLAGCHVKCEKCQRRLDVSNPAFREWVAVFPTRTMFRSYQVRPFSTSRLKPAYIFGQLAKHQEEGTLRQFYNTVLGEPYTAADAQIQRQDIEACMNAGTAGVPDISADAPVFLGVDVGMICHLTLSVDTQEGLPHFILFETVPITNLENRIDELRRIYPNLVQGAVDRFPYTPQADALRDVTNLLVVPIQYRGTQPLQPVFESDTKTLSHYSANRTLILDRLHSWISHKKMVISGYGGQKETLIAHLSDMVRDEQPDAEAEWKKTTGNDHYFHSMALNLLARRVCEHIYATQVGTTANSLSMFGIDWAATGNLGQHSLKGLDRLSRFN